MTEDQRLRFLSEMFVACGKLDLSIHNMKLTNKVGSLPTG